MCFANGLRILKTVESMEIYRIHLFPRFVRSTLKSDEPAHYPQFNVEVLVRQIVAADALREVPRYQRDSTVDLVWV